MSYYPISVIIVGMGNADFKDMEMLDADQNVLTDASGRNAARDIIQFVKFEDMTELASVEVAENILLEVPHHFVDYMVLRAVNDEGNKEQVDYPVSEMNQSKLINTKAEPEQSPGMIVETERGLINEEEKLQ